VSVAILKFMACK